MDKFESDLIKTFGVAVIASLVRAIMSPRITIGTIIRGLIVCFAVGFWVGETVEIFNLDSIYRYPIVGFCCLIADDLVAVALEFGKKFRKNPKKTFNDIKKIVKK